MVQRWGSVVLAVLVTVYFFRQNLRGLHESSDKGHEDHVGHHAMAVILIVWCGVSLVFQGPAQGVPWKPDLHEKVEHVELKPNEGERRTSSGNALRRNSRDLISIPNESIGSPTWSWKAASTFRT